MRRADNVDDFIAAEMQQIDGGGGNSANPTVRSSAFAKPTGLGSKPNFGIGGKKSGGAFAKPSFMGGAKKTVGGPTIIPKSSVSGAASAAGPAKITLKRKQLDDDFIANEMAQIQ